MTERGEVARFLRESAERLRALARIETKISLELRRMAEELDQHAGEVEAAEAPHDGDPQE